jgi:hypothetical protein
VLFEAGQDTGPPTAVANGRTLSTVEEEEDGVIDGTLIVLLEEDEDGEVEGTVLLALTTNDEDVEDAVPLLVLLAIDKEDRLLMVALMSVLLHIPGVDAQM